MRLTSLISWCLIVCIPISGWPQSAFTPTQEQTDRTAKIKLDVQKRGTGERARVKVTLRDKAEVKGYISQIGPDSFQVSDKKTGSVMTLAYQEVDQVQKLGLSTGAKAGIGAAVVAGVMIGAGLIAYKAAGY
jgi:hypothetical protein